MKRKLIPGLPAAWLLTAVWALTGCGESSGTTAEEPPVATTEAAVATADEPRVAATTLGRIRGSIENSVRVFKGIPYGADTADTRFQAPQLPDPWEGTRETVGYGDSCPQVPYPATTAGGLFASWGVGQKMRMSEDCLRLNVWTPALRDGGMRPVMVWLHGGGFSRGSGSSLAYDGVRLVNRGDVVLVTVNHRLNVFGYLNLAGYGEQFADSGTAGLLDLVLALQWVQDNIVEFGGDPDKVTIFGESGGGMKVSALMAMDAATGMFDRAIVQSGPWLQARDPEVSAQAAEALISRLELSAENVDEILALPTERIKQAAIRVEEDDALNGWNGPVRDRNLQRDPFAPDAPPQSADVPMLIGINRTETSLFIGPAQPQSFSATWGSLPTLLQAALPDVDPAAVIATYRRLNPDYEPADVLFTATTDAGFFKNSVIQADRKALQPGADAYFYFFNWDTPVDDGKWRVPHALEIGMVFDNVAYSTSMSGVSEEAQAVADIMADSWLAFAKTGNPNNPRVPPWPAYNTQTRPMMVLDLSPEVVNNVHGEQRQLFD